MSLEPKELIRNVNKVSFFSVSKHLESLYGRNWKEKVIQATASQDATVHGVLTGDPAGSPRDTSPHPIHASSTINSTVTVQPSPRGDTSDPHTPSLKETLTDDSQSTPGNDSSVDPAARFAQRKEQGNSWVKQVHVSMHKKYKMLRI